MHKKSNTKALNARAPKTQSKIDILFARQLRDNLWTQYAAIVAQLPRFFVTIKLSPREQKFKIGPVHAAATVNDLKVAADAITIIPMHARRILLNGMCLDDGAALLHDCGVSANSTLTLVACMYSEPEPQDDDDDDDGIPDIPASQREPRPLPKESPLQIQIRANNALADRIAALRRLVLHARKKAAD